MRTILLIFLWGGVVQAASAQGPRDRLPGEDFADAADLWFNHFCCWAPFATRAFQSTLEARMLLISTC
jgi:hypothetical protein